MKAVIFKYKYIIFLSLIFVFLSGNTFAQEKHTVKGTVSINGGDLNDVKITLYKDSQQESVRDISNNGKFSYQLDFGYDYIFEFSKQDFVTKRVRVSTYVPQVVLERDSRFPPSKFSIELFRFFPGIDLSIFDQPIGVIMYNNETDLIEIDLSFQTGIEAELKRIEKETRLKQEAYLAELARINAEYGDAIKKGDTEFQKKNYIDSKSFYTEALNLKSEEIYPKDQISKIETLLLSQKSKLEAQRLIDEKYNAFIELADKDFVETNYEPAKVNYKSAIGVKPGEIYPKDQLEKINNIELELKLNAENEAKRLAAEEAMKDKYDAFITAADEAFKLNEYGAAKSQYTSALNVKPDEVYPQNQIQLINDKLDYQRQLTAANAKFVAEQKALKAEYNRIIKLADVQFKKKDYPEAIILYEKAIELDSEESYPKLQIQVINEAITNEKELAANQLKQKEIDDKYNLFVDSGDKQLKDGEYSLAKQNYIAALALKPNESHPKAQLLKIESLMAQQAKILAEKDAREKKYADLISLADSQMNVGDFDKALGNYEQALNIKPNAAYLDKQVKKAKQGKVDKKQEQEEKAKQELELQIQSQKYNDLIAKGDTNLAAKKYFDSRDNYKDALEIKPDEKYPKDQLNKLEDLMAKELHQETAIKEFEIKYQAFITTGDSHLKTNEYELARKSYKRASEMKPEESYPKLQLKKLDGLIAEANRIEAESQLLNEKYEALIGQADRAFEAEDYKLAITSYQSALSLKEKENYPIEQIKKSEQALVKVAQLAQEKLKEEKANSLANEKYAKAITLADAALTNENYKSANSNYEQALEYKKGDQYATAQLLKIKSLIAEKESKAKADELLSKKKAILDKQFRLFVSEGDKLFKNEKYANALEKYEAAIQIMRNDEYALKQIDIVKEKLVEEKLGAEKRLTLEIEYDTYISSADKLFADNKLKSAKEKYQLALKLKFKSSYPKNQIEIIDETLAKQEKIDRKNNRLEEEFEESLAKADSNFKKKSYTLARNHYKDAQKIKPHDAYVKSQLSEIKMILEANMQSKENDLLTQNSNALSDNLLKLKEQEYKAFIVKGDEAIKDKYLGKAKAYYVKALGVFDRDYPREKLVEIEELRSAFRSEKDRLEYEKLMRFGEKEYERANYSVSRHYLKKALYLAADRSVVEEKLDEIEQAITADKQKALDLEFDEFVKKGNTAFKSGNLSVAKFYFTKALKIKPKDSQLKENMENIKNSLK
ncbi:hypothetical protein DWB61_05040 [Ancylomarina euxinus]|uniref:Tetratricopeptide repeat protein n=1 Tax=Ancylomarina euxinus TaxID=2283627 RepID=A0A425Y629_9BACT|nr:tetratricopeptide repeat protein [Ancylomarina euxinus]MCZ4694224.1 tetratricopeptide repeat protein [Ancylomarina euxinus]MUP14445.1 tetratricopeptide repeat protein [Ancylomarina euxinus]RRG23749.1 hypothetical protein DWB61_05040 [Ancylomarina euxinus]